MLALSCYGLCDSVLQLGLGMCCAPVSANSPQVAPLLTLATPQNRLHSTLAALISLGHVLPPYAMRHCILKSEIRRYSLNLCFEFL